jgi:ribose 5-phosphate isomerase B
MGAPGQPSNDPLAELVRGVVARLLAGDGREERAAGVHVTGAQPRPGGTEQPPAAPPGRGRSLVTTRCLRGVADGGEFPVPAGALVTDLAREEAERRQITLRAPSARSPGAAGLRIAVGCDHGGLALKRRVLATLANLGHRAHDLGTHDERPVDYPDFAVAVAREVQSGRAELGVCIDGAGIGSAMAAGKVAGVRAANCTSVALARNAREHNYANVLCLGGRTLATEEALAILETFLTTPYGEERHGRRVAKIDALDAGRPSAPRST